MVAFKDEIKRAQTQAYFHFQICDIKLIQTDSSQLLSSSVPVPETQADIVAELGDASNTTECDDDWIN